MNANKALWESGDFTRIAASMRESGEDIVRQVGLAPGMRVLDLGCGDGTTAIPAAKLGADVLGVDIASNLVAAGNRRAAQAGLSATCRFVEGDACNLSGIENKSFDRVITLFGAMFAPKPFDAAREMVRVTRPGGRIVMGNWIPNDPTLGLGHTEQRDRTLRCRRHRLGGDHLRARHLCVRLQGFTVGVRGY